MSALNAALCRSGIILWLAVVLLLASRSTHSAPVYDQDTTQIAEYDGATPGCYFNYQRYQEGDRIMTSEPCLNCTCHNRMLMCYLKVCPFTKAIGQDCTVEKRPDQCCPVITCPEVPVQLLTSTTSAPDSTEIGFHDNYGCHVDERFYADGAMLPLDHHNPCELCYCIRNRTTCVMQECTLQVAGCKPVYQPGVCCPIKYNCEYDEESSTTVGPTPGLIMTTTLPPGILPQCYYEGKVYEDGDLIYSTQPCQHCYCFRGEIACAVQNCGTPMQEHGKNCTALPPPEGECCPTIYECEGITTVRDEGEEQFSEQVPHGQVTESPILIDQEDQQTKGEQPQEEVFPGIDNNIPYAQEEEEDKTVQGTIEHITQGHIPSTEKPEEETATLPTEKIETTTAEKEVTPSHEHVTETSPEITSEKIEIISEVPSETEATKLGAPTTVQGTEESLVTEGPATELPEVSSIAEGLQPEEKLLTTEHVPTERVSTEENIIEEEHSTPAVTERGQSIEPSISETTQTEGPIKEEETTSPHEELSTQTQEEITQEGQIGSEKPESSTEAIEKTTSPIEELGISTVSESISEQPKADEGKPETMPGVLLATETESPKEEETVTPAHEVSSTEQITTEREEVSHPTETAITEQSTEISGPSKEQPVEEQKSVISEGEKKQRPEETTSEHAIIEEQATVGAKKEDAGLTESSVISEEPLVTEVSHAEEESTPEIPAQGPTGIPIPERSPEQKAEDESVYHVTEDYHGVTHPEISPDNLITEVPQKIPVTHLPQEQETTLAPSEETAKPIATEGIEVSMEGTTKPIKEATEINLPTERKPEITTVSEETQSTPAVTEVQISTESSTAIIAQRIPEEEIPEKSTVPEETVSEIPQTEIQLTEKSPSTEEMPTKEFEESSESSGEVSEKEAQPKKEEETQPPIITEPEIAPEISTTIPAEHSTVPSDLEKEHTTAGEYVTTVISSTEQSTHVPQVEEKETEIVPIEKEEPITEKPVEEHVTEHLITTPGIIGEKEKELQTEEPVLKEEQTTEAIKTIETEEERTTRVPAVEEGITEQPEQYTKKALEEAAVTESHGPEETESTKAVSTESTEQQTTTVTEKEPTEEIVELKPTEITGVEQTELPVEHTTEAGKIEEEGEEKISVPVSTEEIQTEIPEVETEATETTAEPEKKQTETSISGIPSQPPIPSDRKEDQESIEPEHEEQLTQKPEKEITETYEEPQKPTVLPEEEISHIPSSESTITESVLPEEKPVEGSTTESVTVGEVITPEQPEISSEQPKEVTTEPSGQEEQTQQPITEKQPEIHEKTEIEASSPATHEESSTPEVSTESVEDIGVSKTTETAESEGTTISVLVSEASTKPPGLEEFTKHEVPAEKEFTPATESIPSEKEQPEIQEQATQPSLKEETPIKEKGETESPAEISTEEGIISETPEVSITEQPLKSEEEIVQKMITEVPEHEEKEIYSTVVPKETIQYTTSIPEEISVEEESTTEFALRPSGIPGEGNCLVEGQSYSNNSAVPPANACQTSCHCISSIVQCELVQCPAPPAHLSNCMPVHTNGESCCPMYACDSTPTAELESDSHVIEPHVSGEEEIQKTVSPTEISKEAATESSTLAGEISTPKLQPVEITVPPITSEEETATEKQQTTLKPIETVYEQPTTVRQPIEQYPEEHTISSVSETSQEPSSQIPEEHTVSSIIPVETTESKISEEGTTESAGLTEQPQEEIGQKQIPTIGEAITSTQVPAEQESHSTEEPITVPSLTEEKETSVPVEVEESSIPIEKEQEVTTTAASKAEETSIPTKEQEKPTEEEGIEQQSTFKPIEKEQPEEEKVSLKPISEEPVTIEEQETSTKSEEILTEKPGIQEEQSTSVPEIQSTTEHKPESEIEKEKEHETVTSTETAQTEEPESQTKLPPSEIETQEPIIPTAESTTLIHDHTISEETSTKEYTTIKSVEISTEKSTKTELKITTQTPTTEEEHVTVAILPETETPIEGTTKLVEESTPKVSHEETLPETTESAIEKEITEYPEKQTEPSIIEHEEEPSTTKLLEEKPSETESSVISEEPTEPTEEHEKPTETSVAQEPGSTQVSVEKHPETTPEIESHTPELPAEEHTEEISTTSASVEEKAGEQSTTPIVKETEPSLSEEGTEQPVISESETPVAEEEHVTVPIVEQTSKSEYPIEEQTVTSPSEEKITEGVSTEVIPVTSQEEQITEKTIESVKPETQLPDLAEEHTVVPEIYKKDEEQKPEIGTTEEPGKEYQPTTVPELIGAGEKETEEAVKEEAVTSSTIEEHTTQKEIESVVKTHETTIIPKEQKPEEEGQVTEAYLPGHPVSEEATTVTSLAPEEYSIEPVKTEEQSTHEPEYQTTLSTAEVSQPVTEISEVEKLPPEEETVTAESTEKPEEPVTKLEMSSTEKPGEIPFETEKPEEIPLETEKPEEIPLETEKPEEIPFETEKPIEPERETEPPEQGETTTKAIESAVTKEILPEEAVSVEVTPKVEEKPTEASTAGEEEEVHSTQSTETTSVYKEEQPSITKLEPTERPLPSEEVTPAGEIQPTQPEESEEAHPTVSEEGITEEPQFTTEHAPEAPVTTKTEEHPEVEEGPETIVTESPIKVSSVKPTELPEETTTVGPEVVSEVPESQIPIKEEGPQPETPVEEPVTKTQPITTEISTGEITEEIPEEEPIHPQEGEEQTHIDHFPEATVKPETDYGFHEQRPATTPHIPEYPDQSGISGEDNSHFPLPGYPNPDDDYGEDDYGGPGTCRYGGKVYVSAQQIPRDDPCDFCFCFRSDIICLQQSCPPPIPGCHEEPISGFCCPRYECPVSMATALNLTTTTTTTTTTLPPHFPAHAYKGAARRSGCQLNGHAYRVGEVIKSASNPCLRCICGNDGKMKCDPQVCSPEPMLRQMIAATTDAKRRR
ncbi:PREDICTED: titin isoform X2 [Trachymyrmex cornetzi]|uniref:titin isoform X2 n=1 Tax=Trachymyrmex cornetzi TaxID=471704 RepID=UPI00084F3EF9|nr:PREDICTED: titin isoform X2 [Trachymyrmex cornetzi]